MPAKGESTTKADEEMAKKAQENMDETEGTTEEMNSEQRVDIHHNKQEKEEGKEEEVQRDMPPPSCKKCFINFAERKSLVCNHEFCAKCWETMVDPDTDKSKNKKSSNEGPETATPAVFKCSVCGASNAYSRPKSAYPKTTIETLDKGVKKVTQFRCLLKKEKILPEAMVVSCNDEFIFVDTTLKEVVLAGDSGETIGHFPYLRNHQFQGGLGVNKEGVILIALKNEKFSGVSYYKKTGQFKFSAFLYDDAPHSGSIQSLSLNPQGSMVVLDSDKMNLCYISREKLVEIHPLIFKTRRSGFRVDESNNGLEKRENSSQKDVTEKLPLKESEEKQESGNDEKGNESPAASKEDGESDVNKEGKHEENEQKEMDQKPAEGTGTEKEQNTVTEEGNDKSKSGDSAKGPATKNESAKGPNDSTPSEAIRPGSITSIAVNSWGQMYLCNLDNKCIHIQEKQEHYDTEIGQIDVSSFILTPTCPIMGKLKCIIDDQDNIILLERFTNTVHRLSSEGEYIDSLVKFPMKDTSMYEDNIVYNIVDVACTGKGNIAVLVRREEGDVIVDGESGEGLWQPEKKTAEVSIYSYSTPRKFRRKDQKPTYPGFMTDEPQIMKPKSACCSVM